MDQTRAMEMVTVGLVDNQEKGMCCIVDEASKDMWIDLFFMPITSILPPLFIFPFYEHAGQLGLMVSFLLWVFHFQYELLQSL